jgi:hypothetical protein
MGDGILWENTADGTLEGYTAFGKNNHVVQSPPAEVLETPEPWMNEIVGGRPLVVDQGVALDAVPPYSQAGCDPHFCALHPRTAAGLSEDGGTLILATIDGRYDGADGMTSRQVGDLMVEMGAWRALNMDGGGSTTMYIENQGGVVNNPSGGAVRTVSNHLGIQIVEPFGDLTAIVRDTDADAGAAIAEAELSLSTGETGTTDASGECSFTNVASGEVTVTATAPGYQQGQVIVDVIATESVTATIALVLAPPEPDGGSNPDSGTAPVTGLTGDGTDAGCGCSTAGAARSHLGLLGATVLPAALGIARRLRRSRARRDVGGRTIA